MTDISLCHEEGKMILPLNEQGNLPLNVLKQDFPDEGLVCEKKDGKIPDLPTLLNVTLIDPKVQQYNGQINEASSQRVNTNSEDKQQTDNKLVFKSFVATPSRTRNLLNTLRIGWLHKKNDGKSYSKIKKPLGGIKRLKLDESLIYSADEIKEMAIKEFTSNKSRAMMDQFSFDLGFSDGQIVDHFKRPDGKICDIWGYCDAHRLSMYKLNLFLLSSSKNGTDITPSENDEELNHRLKSARTKEIKDNISMFYHYMRVSKYSNEQSYTECTKANLYTYIKDDQSGMVSPIEEFDPLDYGCTISRLIKDDKVLLQIYVNENGTKSFDFPLAESTNHMIVHDIDEVQGIYDGKFGIGLVPSCTDVCHPIFTWYRDGEVFREGEYLYWLNDVLENNGETHTWSCVVTCKGREGKLKSKDVEING